jgi:hypothetical protein
MSSHAWAWPKWWNSPIIIAALYIQSMCAHFILLASPRARQLWQTGSRYPQLVFFLMDGTVMESAKYRQGKCSVTVTVRDRPSGKNWGKKSTFPDGKPSLIDPWWFEPSKKGFSVGFPIFVTETFPIGGKPSGKYKSFPSADNCQKKSKSFPIGCRQEKVNVSRWLATVRES